MDIDDLRVYQLAMQLAEKVWGVVLKWDAFAKYSILKQYTKAADSIGANISEGFGRFHFKDSKKFLYYSRGSLFETLEHKPHATQRSPSSSNTKTGRPR